MRGEANSERSGTEKDSKSTAFCFLSATALDHIPRTTKKPSFLLNDQQLCLSLQGVL